MRVVKQQHGCRWCTYRWVNRDGSAPIDPTTSDPYHIIGLVARELKVSFGDLTKPSRANRNISDARFIAIDLVLKRHPRLTLTRVGRYFNRPHCGVIYAREKASELMVNPDFKQKYNQCATLVFTDVN